MFDLEIGAIFMHFLKNFIQTVVNAFHSTVMKDNFDLLISR